MSKELEKFKESDNTDKYLINCTYKAPHDGLYYIVDLDGGVTMELKKGQEIELVNVKSVTRVG